MSVTTTYTIAVDDIGPIPVTVSDRGAGRPVLVLHGGAGPISVNAFADELAQTESARVLTPTHPGFNGTPRPDELNSIRALAALYSDLLDALDLTEVTVIGNSIGGWIAAEMATLASPRIRATVLVDAVGIDVPGHPVVDFFSLTLDQVAELSYHDPDSFRIDPSTFTPEQQTAMAGNRAALAVYGGTSMTDPDLAKRLALIEMPTLVVWGDADRIADPDYGRAYAAAIPGAQFQLLTATGHVPQLETPQQLLDAVSEFTASHVA
jgi:pimeloyl-ACP methyl ester carboxylesterase